MNKMETLLYNDDKSARFVEGIKGWVDKDGRFFGNDKLSEHMARYSSCTHMVCDCGEVMPKGWTKCKKCIEKQNIEDYNKLPFIQWDRQVPVFSKACDQYFFDSDAIDDYLEEEGLKPEDLRLVICHPNNFMQVEPDYWQDVMPEDREELPTALFNALEVFNSVIKSLPPASWSPSKYRTEYIPSK